MSQLDIIENELKELLENMLMCLENFVEDKSDLTQVEKLLTDYDDVVQLVGICKNIFGCLTKKIEMKLSHKEVKVNLSEDQDDDTAYMALEKQIQKYEHDIRNHIKLKLYADALQQKLDECEADRTSLLESTKKMINEVKRENQQLSDELKKSKIECEKLKKQNHDTPHNLELPETNVSVLQQKVNILQDMLKESMMSQLSKGNEDYNCRKWLQNKLLYKTEQNSHRNSKLFGQTPPKNRKATPSISSKRGSSEMMMNTTENFQKKNIQHSASKENHLDKLYKQVKGQSDPSTNIQLANLLKMQMSKQKQPFDMQKVCGRSSSREKRLYSSELTVRQK